MTEGAGPGKGTPAKLGGGRFPTATHAISGPAEELLRAGFAGKHGGVSAVRALEGAQEQQRGRRWGGNRIYIAIHRENPCLRAGVTQHRPVVPAPACGSGTPTSPARVPAEPSSPTLLPEKCSRRPQKKKKKHFAHAKLPKPVPPVPPQPFLRLLGSPSAHRCHRSPGTTGQAGRDRGQQ